MNWPFVRRTCLLVLVVASLVFTNNRPLVAQDDSTPSKAEPAQVPSAEPPAAIEPVTPGGDEPATPVGDEPQEVDPANELDPSEASALGYKVLMQGPVHEAFAAPIDPDPTDGVRVIPKAPPEPVDEQPPEVKPEDGLTWIPGYWGWSDDNNDYVWVSGLWRKFPPQHNWKPGYWSQTGSGYRWTSGFWTGDKTLPDAADYLPQPPTSIDNGPSVPPPNDDYFWVPGHWEYANSAYRWRSGFWSVYQGDWVWNPANYCSTPRGYLFVNGYWDYLPTRRGYLYAPVSFYNSAYLQPNYIYRPRYPLVSAASLLLNLFVRRGYSSYYYGNYYGPSYLSSGYRPWYDTSFGYGYRAPWFSYYNHHYGQSGINFVGSMQRYEHYARSNSNLPQQHGFSNGSTAGRAAHDFSHSGKNGRFASSMDEFVRSDAGRVAMSPSEIRSRGSSGWNAGGADSWHVTIGSVLRSTWQGWLQFARGQRCPWIVFKQRTNQFIPFQRHQQPAIIGRSSR